MKKVFLPIAIALLSLTGCVKDATLESEKIQIVDPNPPVESPEVISFQSYLPAKFTKTTTMVSTNKTIWNVDDPVYITDGTKGAVYTALKGGKDSTLLNYSSGDTLSLAKGSEYLAVFPSEVGDFNGEKGAFGLPSSRTYLGYDRFGDVPMVARKTRAVEDGTQEMPKDTLNFKNLCGVLKINITEPEDLYTKLSYLMVKSLSLSADVPVCGNGSISFEGDAPKITLENNDESIVVDCNNELRLSTAAQPVYIYLPEGQYPGFTLNYNVQTTSTESAYIKAVAETELFSKYAENVNILRGSTTEISVNLTEVPKDVAIPQTSNCMIVYGTGSYWFKPTKAETDESVGEVDHAVLFWESLLNGSKPGDGQIITSVGYDADKDSVNFVITEYPDYGGNCLIGVADKDGKILWSYHIWLQRNDSAVMGTTCYDTEGLYPILNVSMGGTGIVTSTNGSSGNYICQPLLYQWGRKDPFTGQGRNISDYGAIQVAGVANTSDEGPVSLETANENPTVFYKVEEGNEWCSDPASATWDGPEKSVTDPCPYGYRVMPVEAFEAEYFSTRKRLSNRGIMFGNNSTTETSTSVIANFANSSCITPTSGKFSKGSNIYCWTRSSGEAEGTARNFYGLNAELTIPLPESAHAYAYPVRCQLIVSNPE